MLLRPSLQNSWVKCHLSQYNERLDWNKQWWRLDTWSRSRDSSQDPFLRVPVSKVLGLVTVSRVSGLETLNIAKKWFIKISIIQIFFFVVFAGKKQPKHIGKMPEIWKKFKSEVMTTFSFFYLAKCTNFEVSSLGLGVFDEVSVSSRNFNLVSVSKVTVSTTSLVTS